MTRSIQQDGLVLPTLPPLFSPRLPSLLSEPPSPVTPTTPSTAYLPALGTVINEPWLLRVKGVPPRTDDSPDEGRRLLLAPEVTCPRVPYAKPYSTASSTMSSAPLKRKVVIMGSPSVGKTSLTQQYVAPPTYNESYFPTIEATSHKAVSFDGVEYDCEIIDSAGQDEYTLFPSKYAVGVHGYLLVYSINSRQSFEMIETVHDKILDFAGLEKVPCVVVGQKSDLITERRVTTAEGEALAKKMKAAFIESSAKDNKNVGRAFEVLLSEMQREYNPKPEKKKKGWFGW